MITGTPAFAANNRRQRRARSFQKSLSEDVDTRLLGSVEAVPEPLATAPVAAVFVAPLVVPDVLLIQARSRGHPTAPGAVQPGE